MGDCVMSEWGSWSKCTRSCGVGIQSRLRQELTSAKYGGKPCGLLSQHQLCGMRNCPVDCEVTPWGTWGACNKKCIDRSVPNVVLGKRKRVRMIMTTTSDGGKQCPSLLETAPCDPGPCQIHCEVSQWHADVLRTHPSTISRTNLDPRRGPRAPRHVAEVFASAFGSSSSTRSSVATYARGWRTRWSAS